MTFEDVIDPVVRVRCINFIRLQFICLQFHTSSNNILNCRRLSALALEYGELHLYRAVRWLSKGEILKNFYDLRDQVLDFLEEKQALPAERALLKS